MRTYSWTSACGFFCLSLFLGQRILSTMPGATLPSYLAGQTANQTSRPHRDRPSIANESFAPYWTAEPGWHTELQLRNNLQDSQLEVTPLLRLADGGTVKLAAVTVPASHAVSVDVKDQLMLVAPDIVNKNGSFGSVTFSYTSPGAKNLYAAVMVHMDGRPIGYHVDAFPLSKTSRETTREGIWWLPSPAVKDILVVSNGADTGVDGKLSLYDAKGKESSIPVRLDAYQSRRFVLRNLVVSSGLSGTYGGLTFSAPHSARVVDTVHFLYEPVVGFSALMKMFDRDPQARLEERIWAGNHQWTLWAPMLALQSPDPAIALPAGTKLQPLVTLRNTTPKTITADMTLTWRGEASRKGTTAPKGLTLGPFETRQLDIGAIEKELAIPDDAHWALVTLATSAAPDDLIAIAASYDNTGRYGTQTPFSDQLSAHWVGGLWRVDATHNSIVAVANAGAEETDALLTIFFDEGKQKYEIQQTIAPGDQMWLNLGELIQTQMPDRAGRVLPLSLTSGTYELRDLKPGPGEGGNLFEGKLIVDKTWGHLTYGCMICCGFSNPYLDPATLNLTVGSSGQTTPWAWDNCNNVYAPVTFQNRTYWTDDTNVATVQFGGNVTGASPGSATNYLGGKLNEGDGVTYVPQCPMVPEQPFDAVNVAPKITSVSPSRGLIGATTSSVTISGQGFSGGHINTPAAIQVSNITTFTDTQITFDAVISSTATPGNNAGAISVTTSGQTSNAKDFYVQVPTNLSIVSPGTGSEGHCQIVAGPGCGTTIAFTYQVNDQASQPINAVMSFWDSFAAVSPDPLQIDQNGGFATTCSPANTGPCNKFTLSSGQFNDAGLGACSTICLVNGACVTGGPSNVDQTWHIAGQPIVQHISLYCEKVLVNGVQP
jgi:hypothetical protein